MNSSDGDGGRTGDGPAVAASRPSAEAACADLLDRLSEAVAVVEPGGGLVLGNAAWRRLMAAPDELPAATFERLSALPHFVLRSVPFGPDATAFLAHQDEPHLLREILDHLGSTVAVYDPAERYRYGNAAFHALYGHHGHDDTLIGKTFEEMLRATLAAGAPTDVQAVHDPEGYVQRRLAEFRDRRPGESERLSPSGRWDLLRTTFTPSGLRLSMRTEITEQKRIQEELRRAKERLEVEGAAQARFVARLSHDLRTPLSAVLGYAELIESEVLGPLGSAKYQEYAALIRQSGRQLLGLVEGLLEMSRTQARRGEMREEPVDLPALLRAEIAGFEPPARDNRTQLALILPSGLPRLRSDPRMLRQMVQALVANAIRHTVDGVVSVGPSLRDDGGIDVTVRDTGSGMSEAVLARIGEPYFQGPGTDSASESGAGLGIAIVKDLLLQHQGGFHVTSAEGSGTEVTLSFPQERTMIEPMPGKAGEA